MYTICIKKFCEAGGGKMENGQFEVYTGNGKGKTTAAIGLAVRALGAGYHVYFGQFIKDMRYSEIAMLENLSGITVEQFGTGRGCLVGRAPAQEDYDCAKRGLEHVRAAMLSGKYDIVIADEINVAGMLKLLTENEILSLPRQRPGEVELVFTGRGALPSVKACADLVTEMREVKHYYAEKGLIARLGIEK